MKLKSIVALLMAMIMAFALIGCQTSEPAAPAAPDSAPAGAADPAAAPEKAAAKEWAVANKIDVGSETKEELYELAKAEGKVVLYSISSRCTKVADSFMAEYPGVVCEAFDISSDELMEKITREYDAGVRNCDVVHCKDLDGSVYMEQVQNNVFHNYYPDDIVATISHKELLTYAMPLYLELNQWFYSSALYDEAPVDSWWDLTKEEWRGNLIMQDPVGNHNYLAVFTAFLQYADEIEADYEREFGKPIEYTCGQENAAYELIYRFFNNDVIFAASSDEVCESVAGAGVTEKKLGYGASSKVRKNKDNGWTLVPINIRPSTGIPNPNNLYIVDEAPHPNAAKLLVRWMVGEADGKGKGFDPFNTLGGWSVRDNVTLAEGSTPMNELKVWDFDCMFVYENIPEMEDFILALLG